VKLGGQFCPSPPAPFHEMTFSVVLQCGCRPFHLFVVWDLLWLSSFEPFMYCCATDLVIISSCHFIHKVLLSNKQGKPPTYSSGGVGFFWHFCMHFIFTFQVLYIEPVGILRLHLRTQFTLE
jgi:hypothetical protein